VAGTSGKIHDPEGNEIVNCSWGLGKVSNNLAEAYAFWCGLNLAKEEGIRILVVFGDSLFIIEAIILTLN